MRDFSFFDGILDGVMAIDARRRIIYHNPALVSMTGLSPERLNADEFCYKLIQFEDQELFCMRDGELGRREAIPYRDTVFRAGNREGKTRVRIQPHVFPSPQEPVWLVVLRDVAREEELHRKYQTELKHKERVIAELNDTRDHLIQSGKMALLGQFVAGVSHELNNPLAIALAAAEDLGFALKSENPDMALVREMSQYIHQACLRMMKLSHHMKVFVHGPLEMGQFQSTDLSEIIPGAMQFCRQITERSGIEVTCRIHEGVPQVVVDPTLIEQVLINLIKNAVDSMREMEDTHPRRLKIEVSHDASSERVVISVSDSGPGVPESAMKKLFTPFFTTKPMGKGTGMGLNISSRIAERHGGTLTVKSVAGQGATFFLTLPATRADFHLLEEEASEILRDKRLLIVDDEPSIRAVIARVFTNLGCVTCEAEDGSEALQKVESEKPDVIICDMLMPRMDGLILAEKVRENYPQMGIVLVSGSENLGRPELKRKLFDAVVSKPFHSHRIIQAVIETLFGKSERARSA